MFGTLSLSLLLSSLAEPLSLETVVDRHTAAVGGPEAVENVQNITAVMTWREADWEAEVTAVMARPNRLRVDAKFPTGMWVTEVFDGEKGWGARRDKPPTEHSKEGLAAGLRALELPGLLRGLHEMPGRGHQLRVAGTEPIDGRVHHVVEAKLNDGFQAKLYFDAETWMLTRRREERALHPDIDPRLHVIENRFSDFREIEGVLRPFRAITVDLSTGKELQQQIVSRMTVNAELSEDLFAKP